VADLRTIAFDPSGSAFRPPVFLRMSSNSEFVAVLDLLTPPHTETADGGGNLDIVSGGRER